MLYFQLIKGHIVSKEDFCREYEVTQRSFDRDIEDIRLFLSEAYSGSELRYDRKRNGYFLTNLNVSKELTSMEIILLLTILRESRALRTDEFDGLTESVIETSEQWKKKETKEIAKKIKEKYQPVNHKKSFDEVVLGFTNVHT